MFVCACVSFCESTKSSYQTSYQQVIALVLHGFSTLECHASYLGHDTHPVTVYRDFLF